MRDHRLCTTPVRVSGRSALFPLSYAVGRRDFRPRPLHGKLKENFRAHRLGIEDRIRARQGTGENESMRLAGKQFTIQAGKQYKCHTVLASKIAKM